MSEKKEIPPLDPIAFAAALVAAPILVTACTFWLLLIPVFALVIGGLPYLIFGTPVLLYLALTGPITVDRAACAALLTVLVLFILTQLLALMDPRQSNLSMIGVSLLWGMAFGPIWAVAFSSLYNKLYRNPVA